jgi:nicotinic acid mononucleotide adenylyltransferase
MASTDIRAAARRGESLSKFVPDAVAAYMKEQGLYV